MSNIPKRNLASGCHLLKKIDQPSWRTTRRNYKHIPQIVCISSRFRVLHLLSWEFERSEVLWRDTVILACHLKHVKSADLHETILTLVICHKHVRSHEGVTLYFSVKFPSVASKKTRNGNFSYMSADFRAFSSKTIKKEENLGWTLVNTENLRV